MKVSIKELYNKFKSTANSSEQLKLGQLYTKAVEAAFKESRPVVLHPDLEYIISSSRGLQLFNEFVEQHGLPISEFKRVKEILKHRKNQADQSKVPVKDKNKQLVFEQYEETLTKLNNFKHKWESAFMMFEYYKPKFDKCDYSKIYYEYAINKKPNSAKLLSRYGLGIVPDLVIFNHNYLKNNTILESIMTSSIFFNKKALQWLYEAVEPYDHSSRMYQYLEEVSYSADLKELWYKERVNFFESAINLDFENSNIFSSNDIKLVQDYIKFKEEALQLTTDPDQINKINSQLAKARTLKTNLETSSGIVYDYMAQPVKENIFDTSSDKKPGNLPDYIKKNYDTDYNGDEPDQKEPEPEPEKPPTDNGMDSYKRNPEPEPEPEKPEPKAKPVDDQGRQINYYYYNYSNSFNRHHDNSLKYSKDDNSVRYADNSKTDNSVHYTDNKRDGSVEYSDSKQVGNVHYHSGSHNTNSNSKKTIDSSSGKDFSRQFNKSFNTDASQDKTQTAEFKGINYDKSKNKTQSADFKDINYKKDASQNKSQTADVKDVNYNKDESQNKTQTADIKDVNYKNNSKDDKEKTDSKSQIKKDVEEVKTNNKDNKEKKESCNTFALDNSYFF